MISLIGKIIKMLGNITCIVAAIVLLSLLVMVFANIRPAVIVSGSMEPVMHTGSMAFIDSEYRAVKERDIIAFERAGIMVTHRVVQIKDEGYVTKGDANESEDPGIVLKSELRGRVIMWLPWLGYGVKTLATSAGLTATAAFYLTLLFLYRLTGKEVGANDSKKNTDCSDSPAA